MFMVPDMSLSSYFSEIVYSSRFNSIWAIRLFRMLSSSSNECLIMGLDMCCWYGCSCSYWQWRTAESQWECSTCMAGWVTLLTGFYLILFCHYVPSFVRFEIWLAPRKLPPHPVAKRPGVSQPSASTLRSFHLIGGKANLPPKLKHLSIILKKRN